MAGMGQFKYALQMRDFVKSLATEVVNRERPRYRYAKVVSIDRPNRKAGVVFNGETVTVSVNMGALQPSAVDQVVRVEGIGTDKFITDVLGEAFLLGGAGGGGVTSVAGRTGDVVLTKADVELGNVDNTSDLAKQIAGDSRWIRTVNGTGPDPAGNVAVTMPGHNHSAGDITSGVLPVARGGTGGATQAAARTGIGAAAASHTHTVSDITDASLPVKLRGRFTKGTAQSISISTWTTITWPTIDRQDLSGRSTLRPTTNYIYIRETGWWSIDARVTWDANSNLRRSIRLFDGTNALSQAWDTPYSTSPVQAISSRIRDSLYLTAGTYIYVQVWQDGVASLSTAADVNQNVLTVTFEG